MTELSVLNSIQKLAEFWDAHDSTDFEQELEEVVEPVFVSGTAIKVPLESRQVEAVERMAEAKGVPFDRARSDGPSRLALLGVINA